MDFKDKVVVVTGGAQGIGKCIAGEFSRAGARVHVIDRQEGDGLWAISPRSPASLPARTSASTAE